MSNPIIAYELKTAVWRGVLTKGVLTKGVIVAGAKNAFAIVAFLIEDCSAWCASTPLPDDQYEITYKSENHAAVIERFGPVTPPDQHPWTLERELTPEGVRAETEGKGGVEVHAGGFCLGVFVDHEYDGHSPRLARMLHRANYFEGLVAAARRITDIWGSNTNMIEGCTLSHDDMADMDEAIEAFETLVAEAKKGDPHE